MSDISKEERQARCEELERIGGYRKVYWIGEHQEYVGIAPLLFTWGIFRNITDIGYSYRYCYNSLNEVLGALDDWWDRGFEGEPAGYIVRKGIGGDYIPPKPGPLAAPTESGPDPF